MKYAWIGVVVAHVTAHADVRVEASTGLSLALGDYETHGVAVPIRVAADTPLPGFRHRLLVGIEYAHFSRWFMTVPEVIPGVQLDVGSARATYRVFPYARRGLHFDVGVGISVHHDRLAMDVGTRHVVSSATGVGVPLEVGGGWTIARRVDVDVRYGHSFAIVGGTLAQASVAIGVRL
jgi:hypothetical protein